MSAESHRAAMSAPIRNVVTDNGGARIDQGFVVDHTHDEPLVTQDGAMSAVTRYALCLLAIPVAVALVLTWLRFFS